jgi:DNA-binding HxlR family transcriptional regulator
MLHRTYDDQVCSIARTLEILGERWTLLLVRDALLGLRRFDEFLHSLGIARNVLADRLARLVEAGVFDRVEYQQRPQRFEYRLTAIGRELGVPVVSLMHWGDRHLAGPEGPPRLSRHRDCGGDLHARLVCDTCGRAATADSIDLPPGPGMEVATPDNATSRRSTGELGGGGTMINVTVRRLAAIDMFGTRGTVRRRRIILVEFLFGVVAAPAFGAWLLSSSPDRWRTLIAWWIIGVGLNYVPLAAYAVALSGRGVLDRELAGVDIGPELRRYGVWQLWVLVPLALIVFAACDEAGRRRSS